MLLPRNYSPLQPFYTYAMTNTNIYELNEAQPLFSWESQVVVNQIFQKRTACRAYKVQVLG